MISQAITMCSASFIPSYMKQPGHKGVLPCCNADGIFEKILKKFFAFSSHEPNMWPSPSMCISTTESAFFGFPSTWLYSVCVLLAVISDVLQRICNVLYLKTGNGMHLLLCVLLCLSLPCAWEHMVCWAAVLASFGNWIKGLDAQRIMLNW